MRGGYGEDLDADNMVGRGQESQGGVRRRGWPIVRSGGCGAWEETLQDGGG